MQPSSEEIRERLAAFAAKWSGYDGSERSEAHTFLNGLLACFGTDRKDIGALFEERAGSGFMDMIWPGVCIVEMKRPSEAGNLAAHREQAFDYWKQVSRETGNAGRFVLVCAFHRFEVFEPGAFWDRPVAEFDLAELPDRYESLDFLREREPRFSHDRAELTRGAVALVTDLYNRLADRRAEGPDTLRDFVLQCVWCMFAEDLEMIPESRFSRVIERLREDPERSSGDELGGLFQRLNTPGPRPEHGIYEGVPYANGGLFESPAAVHLERDEVELLAEAASYPWQLVEPAIFGSLLEGALGRDRVWAFGAHYTAEEDIRKVVGPTIVEPWRERIDACETLDDLAAAARDLAAYRVLDPACGSGNFLYVAYRELRRVEAALRARERELRAAAGLGEGTVVTPYPLDNVYGIELEPFAVRLARVTLWMAHKLAVVELGLQEPVLPLEHLAGVRRADALKVEWPPADAIVGNPPYHGSQRLRRELGDDYTEWLKREFNVGLKDYAVYWFRRAHETLRPGGRAGLVATNSISQNRSRDASLDWIVANDGVIVDAIASQPWTGEAKVHVSIVNWVKQPAQPISARLNGQPVQRISSALRPEASRMEPHRLHPNAGRSFQGVIPAGMGFLIDDEESVHLRGDLSVSYAEVVRRYLMGEDIADDPLQEPTRWIVDFRNLSLERSMAYPQAMEIVRQRVKPLRDANRDRGFRERWWQFGRSRGQMRAAIAGLPRYLAANRVGKRLLFCWAEQEWCPGDKVVVFAFEENYSFGVLSSTIHSGWAWALSSTLKADLNYTPTTAFETFPWPQPSPAQRDEIGGLAAALIERRQAICLERQIGLTRLYNEVDDGAYRDLAGLHRRLDEAVAAAYGWPTSAAHDATESNRRLLELNGEIAAGRVEYRPF